MEDDTVILEGADQVEAHILKTVEELRLSLVALLPNLKMPIRRGQSKLGGHPDLPDIDSWPVGKDGLPMVFLMQINLAEMPSLASFPQSGLLQAFILSDYIDTLDDEKDDFAVLYWLDPSNFTALERPSATQNSPMAETLSPKGVSLTFQKGGCGPDADDWELAKLFDLFEPDEYDRCDRLEENLGKANPHQHYLGGYPRFAQGDFRDAGFPYDVTLLTIGPDDNVMWGDDGSASFFIRADDLEKKDFSDIRLYWDCY